MLKYHFSYKYFPWGTVIFPYESRPFLQTPSMLKWNWKLRSLVSRRRLSPHHASRKFSLYGTMKVRPTSKASICHPSSSPSISHFANSLTKLFPETLYTSSDPVHIQTVGEFPNLEHNYRYSDSKSLVVVSFYKFADFPDHADFRKPLKALCEELCVSGGIILAPEGINGSICGKQESVARVLQYIQSDERLKGLRQVVSSVSPEDEAIHHGHSSSSPPAAGEDAPFRWDHVRVKLKKEIVSLGMPSVSPAARVGKYVNAKDWNTLISDPNTLVIDVRNNYETRIGKFKGAIDPSTTAFREFPSWVEEKFQVPEQNYQEKVDADGSNEVAEHRNSVRVGTEPSRIAMYCTGGIRCEKATSYLLSKGFKEVYHLEGGILKYLEEVPRAESLWEGDCFVFDKRVSVAHGLVRGSFKLCYGCKQPLSDADMGSPEWEYGVSCPYCFSSKSEVEKERARARRRQFERWGTVGGGLDKVWRPNC